MFLCKISYYPFYMFLLPLTPKKLLTACLLTRMQSIYSKILFLMDDYFLQLLFVSENPDNSVWCIVI